MPEMFKRTLYNFVRFNQARVWITSTWGKLSSVTCVNVSSANFFFDSKLWIMQIIFDSENLIFCYRLLSLNVEHFCPLHEWIVNNRFSLLILSKAFGFCCILFFISLASSNPATSGRPSKSQLDPEFTKARFVNCNPEPTPVQISHVIPSTEAPKYKPPP